LFKIRLRDGQTEDIVQVEAMNPVWSPDGRMIVYAGAQIGPLMHLRAVAPDGSEIDGFPMIKVPAFGERARFLPDGSGLVYVRGLDPDYDFHLLDLESRRSRQLTKLAHSSTIRTFDMTPDGKTIVFDRRRDNSDIVLIER
jgi:Tol biopolymer transport system component